MEEKRESRRAVEIRRVVDGIYKCAEGRIYLSLKGTDTVSKWLYSERFWYKPTSWYIYGTP